MRYAVYFCPAGGSGLGAFGREWLATTAVPGIEPASLRALLVEVRRYGWHATLSAPFALAEGQRYEDLRRKVADIAARMAPFELPLVLDRLAGFLALRPSGDEAAINALAGYCVRDLHALRAPLSDAAQQRRAAGLDEVELGLLHQFGYPYVLERYRFHMTLAARAAAAEERALYAWLSPKLATLPPAQIDALTLCRENEPGQDFDQLERIPLSGGHAV
jgi:2'-5' RNA ligase